VYVARHGKKRAIRGPKGKGGYYFFEVPIVLEQSMSEAKVANSQNLAKSGGFSAAYQELLPQFQNTTGITVTTARGASQGDGPNTIGAQLRRGVPADVVIMSRGGLAELMAEGRIAIGLMVSSVDYVS
jgi:Bacterial extracellular solute-binding protein